MTLGSLVPAGLELERADTVPRQIKPTYWKEGGLVGAAVVGVPFALLMRELCINDENPNGSCVDEVLLGGLGGAAIGFLLGALVGGQFDKHPQAEPADSAQVR